MSGGARYDNRGFDFSRSRDLTLSERLDMGRRGIAEISWGMADPDWPVSVAALDRGKTFPFELIGCPFMMKTRDAGDGRSFCFMLGVKRGREAELAVDWAVVGRVVAVAGRCCFCRRRDGGRAGSVTLKALFVPAVSPLKGRTVGDVDRMSCPKLKSKPCSPWTGCSWGVFSWYACHSYGSASPGLEKDTVDGFRRRENNPIWSDNAPKRGQRPGEGGVGIRMKG